MSQDRRAAPVHARVRGGRIEVRLQRVTAEDLGAVKAIAGRRWLAATRAWSLPRVDRTVQALTDAFGDRLVVRGPDPLAETGDAPRPVRPGDTPIADGGGMAGGEIIERIRQVLKARAYSTQTERAYVGWSRRFLRFAAKRGVAPDRLGPAHAREYIEHLATHRRLAAKTRNQAASALAFMFRNVFGVDSLEEIPRAKGPRRIPTVLSHREVLAVLAELRGKYLVIVALLYSAGLRIRECLLFRVKDIDFELRQILVRDGKGQKDRYVPLAGRAAELLRVQIKRTAARHRTDLERGGGWAPLPGALHRKTPGDGFELGWQFVFPSKTMQVDEATGRRGRWPLHPSAAQRQVKRAVRRSGLTKRVTCHTFRHSFATETLRGGCDIRTLQRVMGHKDIRTTMIYLHVLEQSGLAVRSPLDRPDDLGALDWSELAE